MSRFFTLKCEVELKGVILSELLNWHVFRSIVTHSTTNYFKTNYEHR